MPMSGEMRLRQIILALVALAGIWVGVLIQRSHDVPARPFAAGPQPPDFPATELMKVAGLDRPASSAPIVQVSPRPRPSVSKPTPKTPEPEVEVRLAESEPPEQPK